MIFYWAMRNYAHARTILDQLGSNVDNSAFAAFRSKRDIELTVKQKDVIPEIAAFTSDVSNKVSKAEKMCVDDQNTNAIPLFKHLCDHFKANSNALAYAKHRLAALERKKDFEDGKWADLLPVNDLSGWTWYDGMYFPNDKQFRIVSDASGVKFVCDTIIAGDYELEGVIDSRGSYAGFNIGYTKDLNPRSVFIMIEPAHSNVWVCKYGYASAGILITSSNAIARLGPNKFRVKVKHAQLSVYINDQLSIKDFALSEDVYSERGKIAICNYYSGVTGVSIAFSDLRVRKLADAD